jgi:hypothetical protein
MGWMADLNTTRVPLVAKPLVRFRSEAEVDQQAK